MEKQLQASFPERIYQHHHTELLLYTRGITKQMLETEEVLQNFYEKLVKKQEVISNGYEKAGVGYLKVIIRNLRNDEFNANKKRMEAITEIRNRLSLEGEGFSYDPSAIYERYMDAFEKLLIPFEYNLLSMSIQGYTHQEIADKFKLKRNHVNVLLFRIRKKVAKWLND